MSPKSLKSSTGRGTVDSRQGNNTSKPSPKHFINIGKFQQHRGANNTTSGINHNNNNSSGGMPPNRGPPAHAKKVAAAFGGRRGNQGGR